MGDFINPFKPNIDEFLPPRPQPEVPPFVSPRVSSQVHVYAVVAIKPSVRLIGVYDNRDMAVRVMAAQDPLHQAHVVSGEYFTSAKIPCRVVTNPMLHVVDQTDVQSLDPNIVYH